MEVAVEFASRQHAGSVSSAVDLELVLAVIVKELQRHFAEAGIVFGTRKSEASVVGLEDQRLTTAFKERLQQLRATACQDAAADFYFVI
jgi:hypothetical protein